MHVSFHSPEFAGVCVAITAPCAASNPLALQDHWPRKVACALLVFQPTYGDDSGTVLGAFCTGSSGGLLKESVPCGIENSGSSLGDYAL